MGLTLDLKGRKVRAFTLDDAGNAAHFTATWRVASASQNDWPVHLAGACRTGCGGERWPRGGSDGGFQPRDRPYPHPRSVNYMRARKRKFYQ